MKTLIALAILGALVGGCSGAPPPRCALALTSPFVWDGGDKQCDESADAIHLAGDGAHGKLALDLSCGEYPALRLEIGDLRCASAATVSHKDGAWTFEAACPFGPINGWAAAD
jgi:hypothetical protein